MSFLTGARPFSALFMFLLVQGAVLPMHAQTSSERVRARELGVAPGILPTGAKNDITDVEGVRVGHYTLIEGDDIRTGATAILPAIRSSSVVKGACPSPRRSRCSEWIS